MTVPSRRPPNLRPPADLPPSPPVPEPEAAVPTEEHGSRRETDPTRYGDWEIKGIAVDF